MLLDLKKVFLSENEKLSLDYDLNLSEIKIDGVNPFQSPVKVLANALNNSGVVKLTINVTFDFVKQCDRCAVQTVKEINYKFNHNLVVSLSGESDDDYIVIPDYKLELDEVVTSDIILELPLKHLCSSDCKGLCHSCGKNLNNDSCDCVKQVIDPRLEILQQLLDEE